MPSRRPPVAPTLQFALPVLPKLSTLVGILGMALVLSAAAPPGSGEPAEVAAPASDPLLWPETQRAFLQDGPGWLLQPDDRARLLGLPGEERDAFIADFLADPRPETAANELEEGIHRRRLLVGREFLTYLDARARLLFLRGAPLERLRLDCAETFLPLEIWTYPGGDRELRLLVYRPAADAPYRLWEPLDGKQALYTPEMVYWLEQWEELEGKVFRAKRFDLQLCPQAEKVDDATGVATLTRYRRDRPRAAQILAAVAPPADLGAWAATAAATPLEEGPAELTAPRVEVGFPEARGQRLAVRLLLVLPVGEPLRVFEEEERRLYKLGVEGVVEQDGKLFESFRMRFDVKPPPDGVPLALAVDRLLRPRRDYLVRLRLRDEVSGAERIVARAVRVPDAPQPLAEPPVPEDTIIALGEELGAQRLPGRDDLVLVPPDTDVVLGLWRAEVLVSGERIVKVVFLVDGTPQLTRTRPPFTAELRLAALPAEIVVRAEGYDEAGELVAADEAILNQPTGELRVRIVEPARGVTGPGRVRVRAEVTVPEGKRVERLEWRLDDQPVATLERPPWQAEVDLPAPVGETISYLTAIATLDDGSRAEDVRFLNTPRYFEEVEVSLVELYTTVTDRSGRLVRDLGVEEFAVREDGRPQTITKFELVEDLPLTLGLALDTSGSMAASLGEAQRAAVGFLEAILTPRDQAFALTFAEKPLLVMPRTSDAGAVAEALADLRALGWTSLHDAVVHALYYFRGTRGRRALVLLSDGEDTASAIPWRDALEYARRSGVAIYTIGLDLRSFGFPDVRDRLKTLAAETGGRAFFIAKAEELAAVYEEIERELRSQYLVAYASDRQDHDAGFRTVEVEVRGGKLKARTIRGYYP
jgi:VWFA-related protein